MKKFMPVLAVLVMSSAFAAEQPRHIVSIGTNGFGWSGTGATVEIDEDKNEIDDQDSSAGKLILNYSYILPSRLMIGAEIDFETEKSETKYQDGSKTESEERSLSGGISLGYNFNENVYESWFLKGTLGVGSVESEVKRTGEATEDSDSSYNYFKIEFGKRLSFASWGLANFAYTPSIEIMRGFYGGDAEDAGLESATGVTLNLLKFDVLF